MWGGLWGKWSLIVKLYILESRPLEYIIQDFHELIILVFAYLGFSACLLRNQVKSLYFSLSQSLSPEGLILKN